MNEQDQINVEILIQETCYLVTLHYYITWRDFSRGLRDHRVFAWISFSVNCERELVTLQLNVEAPWKHFQSNLAGYWHGFKPRGWVKSLKVKFAWYVVHWAEELSYNLLILEKYVYSWSYPLPDTDATMSLSKFAKDTTHPSGNFLKLNQPSKFKMGVCKTKMLCDLRRGDATLGEVSGL